MNGYNVRELLPSEPSVDVARRWDEMRRGLDWALNRNPMHPSFAFHVGGSLWAAEITGPPWVCVLYEVEEPNRVVTYKRLIVVPAVPV
jgi:hypothetical protein